MIEALVGVLFAAVFVSIYFFISLARQRGDKHDARWPELYPPALPGQSSTEGKQRLFKNADELSRHHLSQGSKASEKMLTAGASDKPAQGQS